MYSGTRPSRLAATLNRGTALAASVGLSPRRLVTLEVRGRRSHRLLSLPLVAADVDGQRYLVSMLGERSDWVRNVRAAGGRAVLRHRRRELVRLVEVDAADRPPILRRYLKLAPGARAHFPVDRRAPLIDFVPIAARYPVFRVVTAPADGDATSSTAAGPTA
jgi:deazaflavin-dependent oxidoreductase (nitroreductase family)